MTQAQRLAEWEALSQFQKAFGKVMNWQVLWVPKLASERFGLLQLLVWKRRYRVPLTEILEILLAAYSFWKPKGPRSLGITVQVLCGKRSSEILDEEIRRRYPDGENIQYWKQREQRKQLPPPTYVRTDDILAFGDLYRKNILKQRRIIEEARERLSQRRYSNNPWL
jgi:hypothetical protein